MLHVSVMVNVIASVIDSVMVIVSSIGYRA